MVPTVWWTVSDEGNALFGFDVMGVERYVYGVEYLDLFGLRRPSTQVGDRPMQFMSPTPFGVMVLMRHLRPAAIQDKVMEFSFQRDEIFGKFIREERRTLPDGNEVHYVLFARSVQVVMRDAAGEILENETLHFDDEALEGFEMCLDEMVTAGDIGSARLTLEEML